MISPYTTFDNSSLVTAAVVCALCSSGTGLGTRFARESGLIALALVVAWSANTAVARTNKAHYGVATVVEFREPAFVAAYGALSRLEPAAWERLIPVPREAIRRAAEHSPATAELLPYLDGAMADGWALEGCLVYDEAPCRGEIRGGWFMWALRAAVSLAGHSESAVDARRFYRRVATEIDAACNDGRLACVAKPLGMAPPFRRDYLVLAARRLVDAFHMLTGFTEAGPMRIQSSGRALELSILRVRPGTLCRITEFSEHESNGRELDEGERVAVEVLPVLGQSAAAVEPGDGAFDHPTPGLDDEALHPIGSLDDLGLEIGQDAGQGAVKDRALIGAVGEQFPEKGKQTEQGRQQRETAGAILNVGGGDDAVQQQALRIDQNMPLLALDQLAGIEAVAVDASPPFSALFTL